MDIRQIRDVIEHVEGWFYDGEATLLSNWAQHVPDVIVEIGSFQGRSTIILALASPESTDVYAIDPHEQSEGDPYQFGRQDRAAFLKNLVTYNVAHKVHVIDFPSDDFAKAWTKPITMLWIDGRHNYEGVKADIDNWLTHVRIDGLVAFHDVSAPQIMQAINERPELELIGQADHTRIYVKRAVVTEQPEPVVKKSKKKA